MISFPILIKARFSHLSFRTKLGLAFGCLLSLFSLLLLLNIVVSRSILDSVTQMHQVEFPLEEKAFQIRHLVQESRRYEKEFLLQRQELGFNEAHTRYVNLFRYQLSQLPEKLDTIDRLAERQEYFLALTAQLRRLAADYEKQFLAAVALIGQRGDHAHGVVKALLDSDEQFATAALSHDPTVSLKLIQMRTLESQFLSTGHPSDAAAFLNSQKDIQQGLAQGQFLTVAQHE